MRRENILALALIFLMFLSAILLLNKLPDQVATHWNFEGQADGFGSKYQALFLIPAITLLIFVFINYLPRISVHKKNIEGFKYFAGLKLSLVIFFAFIYLATLLPHSGYEYNIGKLIMVGVAVLLFYIGFIMKDIKKNYFIGFRTPWTLANDKVWKRTHEVGSVWFRVAAVLMLLNIFFSVKYSWVFILPILVVTVGIVVYSYLIYKK